MPRVRPPSGIRRSLNSQKAPQPRAGRKRAKCFCKLELRVAVHEGALSHLHCAISSVGGVASRKKQIRRAPRSSARRRHRKPFNVNCATLFPLSSHRRWWVKVAGMMCCRDGLPAFVAQVHLSPCARLRGALSRPSVVSLELEVQFYYFGFKKKKSQIISSDKKPPCRLSLWKRRSGV